MKTILIMTLCGSILAMLLLVLRYTVLRKMPSTVYYYAWILVMLRFALPLPGLFPSAPASAEPNAAHASIQVQAPESNIEAGAANDGKTASGLNIDTSDAAESHITLDVEKTAETQAAPAVTATKTQPAKTAAIDWRSPVIWLSVWALGAVVSMGLTVISYIKYNSTLGQDLRKPDGFIREVYASIPGRKPVLYVSSAIKTPIMLGVFSPKIVLPARRYNEELLRNILNHELTHYRRFDPFYKWASAAVLSAHWFNPLSWVIRKEMNRACEMSCDEMLLRSMTRDEKQSYGDSLLQMAATSALPAGVVATTFATEKRNLKERLVQIMNYKKSGTRLTAAILCVTLLTGCSIAAGPFTGKGKVNKAEAPKTEGDTVQVKTVDEFLAAIAPNTTIELAEGEYELSKATTYSKETGSNYYSWNHVSDDVNATELVISNVENLTIKGAGIGKTVIAAEPRYANVIKFTGCKNISVNNLTAGHTKEPGECSGGVILIQNCKLANVDKCGLYGCGTVGVIAADSTDVNVTNSDIYECSVGAVNAVNSRNVVVTGCDIHDHGKGDGQNGAMDLFHVEYCTGFTVYNCKIHDNKAEGLLFGSYSKDAFFLSNEFKDNTFADGAFYFLNDSVTVDGCVFENNIMNKWYKLSDSLKAVDTKGNKLGDEELKAMKFSDIKPETTAKETTGTTQTDNVPAGSEISVKTIDEFLNAIGPDRTIVLDGTGFDLSKATDYGGKGTDYYQWQSCNDGPALLISNVKGLTIKAKNSDPKATTFEALPRYADVIGFKNCENLTIAGFTAGHTKEKGECIGGVLEFANCKNITIEKMRLYGCGVLGVQTNDCSDISILNTEIYECSQGGAHFINTKGITFKDCSVHDVPSPALVFSDCENMTWNGEKLVGIEAMYDVNADGTIIPYVVISPANNGGTPVQPKTAPDSESPDSTEKAA